VTLTTPAPLDAFLNGNEDALTVAQKAGLQLFMDNGCVACHNGVNLGGHDHYPFGLIEKPGADILPEGDVGRYAVTETADDEYVFRAAPLRNIDQTAPYFHSGVVWGPKEAVQIMSISHLGEEMPAEDIESIVAFLGALTGEVPEVVYPVLPAESAGTPRPTGDIVPE